MIQLELTNGKKYLELTDYDSDSELIALHKALRRQNKDHYFKKEYKLGIWDGYDRFIYNNKLIPSGLWMEVVRYLEENNLEYKLKGIDEILDFDLDKKEFLAFIKKLFKGTPIKLRKYQIEAALKILKYKYCTAELATSAGKTVVLYMVISYLKYKKLINKNNKFIVVVSKRSLLNQTALKFEKDYHNGTIDFNIMRMGDKWKFTQDKYDDCEVMVTTYQSLSKMDSSFYKPVKHMGIDEAHTAKGKTIPDALLKCDNLLFRFGVSGTIKVDPKYSTFFYIQQHLGPLVMRYHAHQLIEDGYSPNVVVRMLYLNYKDVMSDDMYNFREMLKNGRPPGTDPDEFGKEMYRIENRLVRESEERLELTANLIKGLGKNTLVLFNDVKDSFGKNIYERIKKDNSNTYYIDGEVKEDDREAFKEIMERDKDVVMVASYGTYSTGIDLKNVHYIVLAESYKAEILIRQTIGRGMREHEDKETIYIIDLIDTFGKYGRQHSKDREEIYKEQKFEIKKHEYIIPKKAA